MYECSCSWYAASVKSSEQCTLLRVTTLLPKSFRLAELPLGGVWMRRTRHAKLCKCGALGYLQRMHAS